MSFIAMSLAAVLAAAETSALASSTTAPAGLPLLDYAFRFASTIADDPKDKAKAQELALGDFAAAGALDEAVRRAEGVEGWRRGVVYADLATALAREGRAEEARGLLLKAEAVRAAVSGWQNPRISAHVAEALAVLGDGDRARDLVSGLAAEDPGQYAGRSATTEAVGFAVRGDVERAMERLASLSGNDDLDVAWWRTSGYLTLARQDGVPRKTRLAALQAARTSADRLPVTRRVEARLGLAEEYARLGRHGDGRKVAAAAAADVETLAGEDPERIPLLTGLGRAWAKVGEAGRAGTALAEAEALVGEALSIDRPGLLARVASGYRLIPDGARARQLDERAFAAAEGLALSRPRALALAAICRQMGRDGVALDGPLRSRLDALLAGLGDPW
jgi:tetratricopeptide (TPR) repeat protein